MMVNIGGRTLEARINYLPKDTRWNDRQSVTVTTEMSYEDAVELFLDDVRWSRVYPVGALDGTEQYVEEDMSTYAMAGPITDNRDGTVTVKMGKYHDAELMCIPLAETPKNHAQAMIWRGIIEDVVQSIPDDTFALLALPLHPEWNKLLGATVAAGYRFRHEGKLYKVLQSHTLQTERIPGEGTESLYTCIDEAHSGTADDPIPYEGNMALSSGLHYTQGGVVYLCNRDTVNPVYNALADLVGLYVEAVV